MFKRYQRQLFGGAAAIICSTALASAQTPATGAAPQIPTPSGTSRQSPPSSPQASTTDNASQTTIVGCLMQEKDVPGRSPNIAERAGVLEDYILVYTNGPAASGAKGSASPGAVGTSGTAAPTPSANATTNLGPLYKVEGIDDDKLRSMVGKRVEVIGMLDKDDAARMAGKDVGTTAERDSSAVGSGSATQTGTTANQGRGDEKDDWMEFKAASIREVSGSCPAPAAQGR